MGRYINTNNLGNVLCSPLKQNMFEHDSMADLDIPHSIINLSEDNECKPNFINFQNSTVQEQ